LIVAQGADVCGKSLDRLSQYYTDGVTIYWSSTPGENGKFANAANNSRAAAHSM